MRNNKNWILGALTFALLNSVSAAFGSEAELKLPPLNSVSFPALGGMTGYTLMLIGIGVCALAAVFGICGIALAPVAANAGNAARRAATQYGEFEAHAADA